MCVKLIFKQNEGKVCGEINDSVSRSWVVTRCTDHPVGCINCCWDSYVRGKYGDKITPFGITKQWQCSLGHRWQAWQMTGDVKRVCKHLDGDVFISPSSQIDCGVYTPKTI